jgi:hypothetical protein
MICWTDWLTFPSLLANLKSTLLDRRTPLSDRIADQHGSASDGEGGAIADIVSRQAPSIFK